MIAEILLYVVLALIAGSGVYALGHPWSRD
jgi:hypothetical protein